MPLYNLHSPSTINKFDSEGNPEASYTTTYETCDCPAGHRPTCRHRQMLPYLEPYRDTHWFLDWDNNRQIVDFGGVAKALYDAIVSDEPPATTTQPKAPTWRRM